MAETEARVGTVMGHQEGPSRHEGLAGWWAWEWDAQSPRVGLGQTDPRSRPRPPPTPITEH